MKKPEKTPLLFKDSTIIVGASLCSVWVRPGHYMRHFKKLVMGGTLWNQLYIMDHSVHLYLKCKATLAFNIISVCNFFKVNYPEYKKTCLFSFK